MWLFSDKILLQVSVTFLREAVWLNARPGSMVQHRSRNKIVRSFQEAIFPVPFESSGSTINYSPKSLPQQISGADDPLLIIYSEILAIFEMPRASIIRINHAESLIAHWHALAYGKRVQEHEFLSLFNPARNGCLILSKYTFDNNSDILPYQQCLLSTFRFSVV
jgi:hypothetical protein